MGNQEGVKEENIKKEELDFVHDEDLLPVLEKLGLKDEFQDGKLRCKFCGDVITDENLASFFEDNGVKFSCNKESCMEKVKKRQG